MSLLTDRTRRRTGVLRPAAVAAAAAVLVLAGCGSSGSSDADGDGVPDLRYATGGAMPPNEMEVAIFDGQLEEDGVLTGIGKDYDLDMLLVKGTPETQNLMSSGQIDVGTFAFSTMTLAEAQKAIPGGFSIVGGHFVDGYQGKFSNEFVTLEGSGIEGPEDLRGKTIGVNAAGSAVDIALRTWLSENGLDPESDVTITEVAFSAQGAALREKRVDMAVLGQPFAAVEHEAGGINVLFTVADVFGVNSSIAIVARNDYIEENPEALRAFLKDWKAGVNWMDDPKNRDASIALIADVAKIPESALDSFYGTKDDYYRDPNLCVNPDYLQTGADHMVEVGYAEEAIDVASLMDLDYLPEGCE